MAAGNNNGFNPFRDAHGRWATPGGAGVAHAQQPGKGSTSMNDALRSASGRATGGGGGGGGDAQNIAKFGAPDAGATFPHDGDGMAGRHVLPGTNPIPAITNVTLDDKQANWLSMDGALMEGVDHARNGGPEQAASLALSLSGRLNESLGGRDGTITPADRATAASILKQNGFDGATGGKSTAVAINDLLATKYANETSEQASQRRLQAASIALNSKNTDHWQAAAQFLDPSSFGADLALQSLFTDATGKDAFGPDNPNLN